MVRHIILPTPAKWYTPPTGMKCTLDSNWTPSQSPSTKGQFWHYGNMNVSMYRTRYNRYTLHDKIKSNHTKKCTDFRIERFYTKKERMIISMGGRYGVPFRLALSPACSTSTTTHKRTSKTQCVQKNCRTTTETPAQHTLLPIVFCSISKGLDLSLWAWADPLPHTP